MVSVLMVSVLMVSVLMVGVVINQNRGALLQAFGMATVAVVTATATGPHK